MNAKKKTRPPDGTGGRVSSERRSPKIHNQYRPNPDGRQVSCPPLFVGRHNAVPASVLARLTGATPRDITKEIERLRKSGIPICADGSGYYIPKDNGELREYLKSYDRRLAQMIGTRLALGLAMARAEGQQTVEGWENGV